MTIRGSLDSRLCHHVASDGVSKGRDQNKPAMQSKNRTDLNQ